MSNYNKICEALKNDNEIKLIMKEKFYQLKIQEAKNKKKENGNNYMDLLPEEITEKILTIKKNMDYKPFISSIGQCKTTYGFIQDLWIKHKLTYKAFNEWIFKVIDDKYRLAIPNIKNGPAALWFAIINKQNLFEVLDYNKNTKNNIKHQKNWDLATKDYTPSIYDFIKYFKEEKEKEKQKKKKEQNEYEDKFKVGDIVWHYGSCHTNVNMGYYKITGTTKTMYRVKKIEHNEIDYCWDPPYNQNQTEVFYIDMDENKHNYIKYKNIGKKTYLELARQPKEYTNKIVIDYCNKHIELNQMYYETKEFMPN
tara:strand:+ start:83 stop:1012 length:930 start_codon:yes stop_codon:yes gene_type:complete